MTPLKNARGMTVMEMMIVVTIVMVIGGSLIAFMAQSWASWEVKNIEADLRLTAQTALDQIARELRLGTVTTGAGSPPRASVPAAPGNTSLTFYLPTDIDGNGLIIDAAGAVEWDAANPVQYQHVPASGQLTRTAAGVTRVLANDVQTAVFANQAIDGTLQNNEVRMTLTLRRVSTRGYPITLTTVMTVMLRNQRGRDDETAEAVCEG